MLNFLDIVVAKVLNDNRDDLPSQRKLLPVDGSEGLVNQFLDDNQIPRTFTPKLTSNQRLMTAIQRLRTANFIAPEGTYVPTDEIQKLWDAIGESWSFWPLNIPMDPDGTLHYDQAEYQRKVRNYRKRKENNGKSGSPP